jgi:hypothetical protein
MIAIMRFFGSSTRTSASREENPCGTKIASADHNGLVGGSSPAKPTTQSFEPEDFPDTAKKPTIGGHLRLRFGLRGQLFWLECVFGPLCLVPPTARRSVTNRAVAIANALLRLHRQ